MKTRFLFSILKKQLDHKNALVITGMRQVGKTTLMRQLYEEVKSPKLWFDFDNPLELILFEAVDYNVVYKRLVQESGITDQKLTVFIDEIQNFPEITRVIKYLIDHYGVKFIVTGSSNYYLRNLFPESLSGRKFLFNLYPLSFQEYLYFQDEIHMPDKEVHPFSLSQENNRFFHEKYSFHYENYMRYGGFPEVVLTNDLATKQLVLKNIFTSFFEKDLRILSDVTDIRELRDLILLLSARIGNILDVSRLSSELGISRVKLYNYLEFLQGIFFLYLIPRYSKSIDRSVAGGRKLYFSDTGIANYIAKLTDGQLFENAVANQLRFYGEISYYNKRNTSEIDFILNHDIAVEVKLHATAEDKNKLEKLAKSIGVENFCVVSNKYSAIEGLLSPTLI
jgi:predicted AAA+ superfamily ATPase